MNTIKIHDGFQGQKLISLPDSVWENTIKDNPVLSRLYVTHLGYFPRAANHYREQRKGCRDNILIYCLRGKGWYSIRNRRFEVGVNQFILLPATNAHLQYGADETDPWTIYWVHFGGSDMNLFNQSFEIGLNDGPQSISFNEKGIHLWDAMYNGLEMGFSKENLSNINFCLYHFIATFLFPGKKPDERKQEVNNLINDTILNMRKELSTHLTVQDLAARHNLSTSHFSSLFRKATGMSPMDYFIHLKLQQACLQLHSTYKKIKTIAIEIGYDDPYYFSRLFKKHMNVSPDEYRGQQRRQA